MLRRCALLVSVLALPLLFSSAFAQWVPNGVPVCAATGEQVVWNAVPGQGGEIIVVWRDFRSDAELADLYVQILDANGLPLLATNGAPLCTAPYQQQSVDIASDENGGAFVTWCDWRTGHPAPMSTAEIYAQHIDASGNMLWGANGKLVCGAVRIQESPRVVSDSAGGALVAWNDERASDGHPRIYMQRLDASGNALWVADGIKIATFANDAYVVSIVGDGAQGAIASWTAGVSSYAQHVDAAGALQWGATGVAVCIGTAGAPVLLDDGSGGCIAAWQDNRTGARGAYMQHFNAAGNPQFAANGIMAMHEGPFSSIISDGGGGVIVAIAPYVDLYGFDHDVYLQRVDASGNWLWGELGVRASPTVGDQSFPKLVPDGTGGAIVTWLDDVLQNDLNFGTNTNLYAQRVDNAGALLWAPNGVPVSTASGRQSGYAIGVGAGQAVAVFADSRSDPAFDLYAMKVLGTPPTGVPRGAAPSFVLSEARPNPFSDATSLDVELSSPATVQVQVYDVAGRRVSSERYASLSAGTHSLHVMSNHGDGKLLSSGVYFARVTVGHETLTRKLVIAR